jgi:hypothetical protein
MRAATRHRQRSFLRRGREALSYAFSSRIRYEREDQLHRELRLLLYA